MEWLPGIDTMQSNYAGAWYLTIYRSQPISITLATSPWHSEHKPTSNKSPALTAPENLVIVTS